jgi:hypothetical protein
MSQVVPAHHVLQSAAVQCAQMQVLAPPAHLDTIYRVAFAHHVLR